MYMLLALLSPSFDVIRYVIAYIVTRPSVHCAECYCYSRIMHLNRSPENNTTRSSVAFSNLFYISKLCENGERRLPRDARYHVM